MFYLVDCRPNDCKSSLTQKLRKSFRSNSAFSYKLCITSSRVQRYCRNQNDIRRNRIHRQNTRAKGIGYISPSGEQRERNTICTEAECCSRSVVTSILTPQKSGRLGRARNTYLRLQPKQPNRQLHNKQQEML